jgi:hypothetical protein
MLEKSVKLMVSLWIGMRLAGMLLDENLRKEDPQLNEENFYGNE